MSGKQSAFAARKALLAARSAGPPGHDVIAQEVGEAARAHNPDKRVKLERNQVPGSDAAPAAGLRDDDDDVRASLSSSEELASVGDGSAGERSALSHSDRDDAPPRPLHLNTRLSSFRDNGTNVICDKPDEWRVVLRSGDSLAILGTYAIWVIKGAIEFSGAILAASPNLYHAFAPSTHAISRIRPLSGSDGGTAFAEVRLTSTYSTIRRLGASVKLFRYIWNAPVNVSGTKALEGGGRSFINVQTAGQDTYSRDLVAVNECAERQSAIGNLIDGINSDRSKTVMITGPKNSGKSTFCRHLLNSTVSKVRTTQSNTQLYLLDLDPGQPEYSPPGNIALHRISGHNFGTPYTHPWAAEGSAVATLRSHFYGSTTPREDPSRFMLCAIDLIQRYQERSKDTASILVVNTCGWVQGDGLRLLYDLCLYSQPTDIIYTSQSGPDDTVHALYEAAGRLGAQWTELPSAPASPQSRTSAELRAMQTQSYFHIEDQDHEGLQWDAKTLSSQVPVVVPFAGPKQGLFAVQCLTPEFKPELLPMVLEYSLVGIVLLDDAHGDLPVSRTRHGNVPHVSWIYGAAQALDPSVSQCIGQGLVRGIDARSQSLALYVPPPVAASIREAVKSGARVVLMRGTLDTPTWAYEEEYHYDKTRARQWQQIELDRAEDDGASKHDDSDDDDEATMTGRPWVTVTDVHGEQAPPHTGRERPEPAALPDALALDVAAERARKNTAYKARKTRRDLRYRPDA